jgi:hypothetical protein
MGTPDSPVRSDAVISEVGRGQLVQVPQIAEELVSAAVTGSMAAQEIVGPDGSAEGVAQRERATWLGSFVFRHTPDSIRAIFGAAKEEWGAIEETRRWALLGRRALLGFNVVGVMAEQFGLNETVIGTVGGHEYQHTHSVLDTAIRTGEVSFGIQLGLGLATAASIHQFPKTMRAIGVAFNSKKKPDSEAEVARTEAPLVEAVAGEASLVPTKPAHRMVPRHRKVRAPERIFDVGLSATKTAGRHLAELPPLQQAAKAARKLGPALSFVKKGIVRFSDDFLMGSSLQAVTNEKSADRSFLVNAANVVLDSTLVAIGAGAASAGVARLLLWGRSHGGAWVRTTADMANFITDPGTWVTACGARLALMFSGGEAPDAESAATE